MAAPRQPHVPEQTGVCPIHGQVTFRVHKIGKDRTGGQRYRVRCPECHSERNQGRE